MFRQYRLRQLCIICTIAMVCLFSLPLALKLIRPAVAQDDGHATDQTEKHDDECHVHSKSHAHSEETVLKLSDKAKANIGLKTAKADWRPIEEIVPVTGTIKAHPEKQAVVTPRISGIVRQIHFSLGDMVKEGDVLLELESLDLQTMQVELIEAAKQRALLSDKRTILRIAGAKAIRFELRNQQIDYLESVSESRQRKTALERLKVLAVGKITATLERMAISLVKADVELRLMETRLRRIKALAEKQISAKKELIERQAEYTQGKSTLAGVKRQFHLLGVSEQTIEMILSDGGKTPILSQLGMDSTPDLLLEKYGVLIEEAAELIDAESAYKAAITKASANKQRALVAGLSEDMLNTIGETDTTASFSHLSIDEFLENYIVLFEDPSVFAEAELAYNRAVIALSTVRQKLQTLGLTTAEMDQIIETGQVLSRFRVRSPASGQVTEQRVALGATVEKHDPLFSIVDTDTVWVQGDAYEDTLAQIRIGGDVRIRLTVYPRTIFTGKVARISNILEEDRRSMPFWVEVQNRDHKLKPGMFAELAVVTQKKTDVLSVPLTAVLEEGVGRFVFVEEGEEYHKHEIMVGAKDDQYIEVRDGVLRGDVVVVQGNYQLMTASTQSSSVTDPHAGHSH